INRLQCLRLTERCADILLSVREEVKEAGDQVDKELQVPIAELTAHSPPNRSFHTVQSFLIKQVHRPFLKRYLKRDEIQTHIGTCHDRLMEALTMFGVSIQFRVLRSVEKAERARRADHRALIGMLSAIEEKTEGLGLSDGNGHANVYTHATIAVAFPSPCTSPTLSPKLSSPLLLSPPHTPVITPPSRSSSSSPTSPHPPITLLPDLQTLQTTQDALDRAQDNEDLGALIRAALRTGSDVEIVQLLQIGREEMPEAIKTLQRALERVMAGAGKKEKEKGGEESRRSSSSLSTLPPSSSGPNASLGKEKASIDASIDADVDITTDTWGTMPDTLDREFIESGIDALRRVSRGEGISTASLPRWTITRYEVDRERKIGVGFFSDVYRGTWRGRTVAIKVLAPTTPRALFVREVQVWQGLRHPGVLQLFGASSACGERPWFFVCAYMKRGSLVEFLKRVEMGFKGAAGAGAGERAVFPLREGEHAGNRKGVLQREVDLYRFMLEIAQGMEYLHENEVLHSDLKAANVLVDNDVHCVISDFGQSEMKSEAYRISGTKPPRGTLRWQAPELMSGESQLALTPQMDVYAYAILCVEIVAMGKLPWPLADDEAVRHFVL
ncbi:hypothetical protein C0993_010344, partial [Termitomyces sp. T159_Od127]